MNKTELHTQKSAAWKVPVKPASKKNHIQFKHVWTVYTLLFWVVVYVGQQDRHWPHTQKPPSQLSPQSTFLP